jgi:hypothetical protein
MSDQEEMFGNVSDIPKMIMENAFVITESRILYWDENNKIKTYNLSQDR